MMVIEIFGIWSLVGLIMLAASAPGMASYGEPGWWVIPIIVLAGPAVWMIAAASFIDYKMKQKPSCRK